MLILPLLFCFLLCTAVTTSAGVSSNEGNVSGSIEDKLRPKSLGDFQKNYPLVFTKKPSLLLTEALDMLRRAKDIKEKQWIETYVHHLGRLAAEMEQSSTSRHKPNLFFQKDYVAQPPPHSAIWTRHNDLLGGHNVDISNTKIKSINKAPKPLKSMGENDELVQQLHSQPINSKMTFSITPVTSQVPLQGLTIKTAAASSPVPALSTNIGIQNSQSKLALRKKLLKQILKKIHLLEKLGGAKEDVLTILKRDEEYLDDPEEVKDMTIEEGAAEGELAENDIIENLRTIAPSADDLPADDQEDLFMKSGEPSGSTKEVPIPVLQKEGLGNEQDDSSYFVDEQAIPAVRNDGLNNEQDDMTREKTVTAVRKGEMKNEHDDVGYKIDEMVIPAIRNDELNNEQDDISYNTGKKAIPSVRNGGMKNEQERLRYKIKEKTIPIIQDDELKKERDKLSYKIDNKIITPVISDERKNEQDYTSYNMAKNRASVIRNDELEKKEDNENYKIDDELVRQLEEEKFIIISTTSPLVGDPNEYMKTDPEMRKISNGVPAENERTPQKESTRKNDLEQMLKRLSEDVARHVMK
ncbi:uncharacterized protein LOC143232795 [Tachypleus tridentatus]|uniref:uncharacterized protein LOC143232795 n=1 Tax=Tachypleus tridentatus TaxID=6853 RepID=UPI003FD5F06C